MKALLYVPLTIAIALALVIGLVFGLKDNGVLVPPPDAVVEGFVRELAAERYERATSYLDKELEATIRSEQLKEWTENLRERTGEILDVTGEPLNISGESAEAGARLKTKLAGEPRLRFTLRREQGIWKISRLDTLKTATLE